MATQKSYGKNRAYLTTRRLRSAARAGIRNAVKETMDKVGFIVIEYEGWVVKKYKDGSIKKISKIPKVNRPDKIVLK